jgi:hypothetical protein
MCYFCEKKVMMKEEYGCSTSKKSMKSHEAKESKGHEKKEDMMSKMRTVTPKMLMFGRRKK